MTQDTEQEMGPGGRGRGRKALPVDPLGDVHAVYGMDGGEEDIIDAEIVDEPETQGGHDTSRGQR